MDKFIAGLALFICAVGISILVMIYGWGLTPLSWWWIIGGGVGVKILIELMNHISKQN